MHWGPPFLPRASFLTSISDSPSLPFLSSLLPLILLPPSPPPLFPPITVICHSLSSSSHYCPPFPFLPSVPYLSVGDLSSLSSCPHHGCSPLLLSVCQTKCVLSSSLHHHPSPLSPPDPSVLVTQLDVYLLSTTTHPF